MTQEKGNSAKRLPWVAAVLSVVMPGVGHAYCGSLGRGLLFVLLYGIVGPVVFGMVAKLGPLPTPIFAVLLIAAAFGVVIAATIDAYRTARRTKPDYERKDYNHLGVYVLLGLIVQGSCVGYALFARERLFEAFRVTAASQFPAIAVGDRVIVDKSAYRRKDPEKGDIVVFHPPTEWWRQHYIKRIVAVAGDTVEVQGDALYINGQPLGRSKIGPAIASLGRMPKGPTSMEGTLYEETNGDRTYRIFLSSPADGKRSDFARLTVPENHCFVMGDNRDSSMDSRSFGPVPLAIIAGRVDYVYWPAGGDWGRFGRIR